MVELGEGLSFCFNFLSEIGARAFCVSMRMQEEVVEV